MGLTVLVNRPGGYLRGVIEGLVEQVEARFAELGAQIVDPEVIGDRNRYAEAGREYRRLESAAKLAEEWRRARSDEEGAQELLDEGEDDMREERDGARPSASASRRSCASRWSSPTPPTTRT